MKTSVALCTYNGEKYIKEQIDSILNQTYKVDEIVVCDDGSTDNTISILEEYQLMYPSIFKIYINPINLKSTKNFQKALRLCVNDIIFLSDQDDIWLPNKVEEFIKVFNENPSIKVVSSSGNCFNGTRVLNNKISVWDIPRYIEQNNKTNDIDYFELIAAITNIATGAAMAIRKEIVNEIPNFPKIKHIHHDELIALIAAKNKSFLFINQKLFNYRIHSEQQIGLEFFDFDKAKIDYLIKPYKQNKTFQDYKQLLKLISRRYKFYNDIMNDLDANSYYYKLFVSLQNASKKLFHLNKTEMKNKFPIESRLINIADFITKKRKL